MFMALGTTEVVLFYYRATADILTKLSQQCFLLYLANSQVSVYRTIGPLFYLVKLVLLFSLLLLCVTQYQLKMITFTKKERRENDD